MTISLISFKDMVIIFVSIGNPSLKNCNQCSSLQRLKDVTCQGCPACQGKAEIGAQFSI